MANHTMLDVSGELKGRAIIGADSAYRFGEIEDVVIDPARGGVLGILFRDESGARGVFDASDLVVGSDAVMAGAGARPRGVGDAAPYADGMLASRLLSAAVVTESGTLLGRVSGIYLSTERPVVVYRVAESTLKGLFGGGFFLDGSVPTAAAPDGARLVVPLDTAERYASSSAEEAAEAAAGRVARDR